MAIQMIWSSVKGTRAMGVLRGLHVFKTALPLCLGFLHHIGQAWSNFNSAVTGALRNSGASESCPNIDLAAILLSRDLRKPDADPHLKDEARRLLNEVKITMKEVRESRFYAELTEQLRSDPTIQCNISRLLGANSKPLPMVIYALGSMEFCFKSQYQLAIAILLKKDFSHWIGEIEVFDPALSPSDIVVLEELSCRVLEVDEGCRRQVEQPTLFFMPYADYFLLGNLLDENWQPSRLNKVVLLTNDLFDSLALFSRFKAEGSYDAGFEERMQYAEAILKYTKAIGIRANYGDSYANIFYDFAWHFFGVDSNIDMETLLPDEPSKEVRMLIKREFHMKTHDFEHLKKCSEDGFKIFEENIDNSDVENDYESDWINSSYYYGVHRGPRRFRCWSHPPPPGWVKLCICGRGCDSKSPAGFGAIFQNEMNEPLATYHGNLGKEDANAATIAALQRGLRCLQHMAPINKLIVVGDNLTVIRWANGRPEPPEQFGAALDEIFRTLRSTDSTVIYHIYEEANHVARSLAEKGSKLDDPGILWVSKVEPRADSLPTEGTFSSSTTSNKQLE